MTAEPGARAALAALTGLLDGAHLATPDEMPGIVAAAGRTCGLDLTVHLVDYEQRNLHRLDLDPAAPQASLSIETTVAGRAFRLIEPVHSHGPDGPVVWLPLIDGVERLGVLSVAPGAGSQVDLRSEGVLELCSQLAMLTGHLVAAKTAYGDAFDRRRRTRERTIAAELVWQLLPPLTFACESLVVSALLEPCYEVAGDVFDYGVSGRRVSLAVFDAVGHTLRSGLVSAVALSTYRNARRQGRDLVGTAGLLDKTLVEQFGSDGFATGVLAELDLDAGTLRYVNAGHPYPLVLRGHRVVRSLEGGRRLPFGVELVETTVAAESLERDDWLVLHSDGIPEARDAAGEFFGVARLVDLIERGASARLPAPETLRRVVHAVLDHQGGVLQDDATVLVAQWASGEERALDLTQHA